MTHDYQPEWDYNVVKPDKELARITRETLNHLAKHNVYRKMGLKRPKIAFVRGELFKLGKYVNGTKTEPVIILDIAAIEEARRQLNLPTGLIVETTVVHELGHAFEDSTGRVFSEKRSENLARRFYFYREIDPRYTVKRARNPTKQRKGHNVPVALRGVR